jgi:phosphoesterase RecJ-like protein
MTASSKQAQCLPLEEAAEEIRRAKSIVMACHVNPDGDAIGSMLGMSLGLAPLNQTHTLLTQDTVPDIYKFLPAASHIAHASDEEEFDLAIVLDSGEINRVGDRILPVIRRARRIIDIDHHAGADPFGDVRLVDIVAASTAEVVYRLLRHMELPITTDIATCLFTGLITDTGSFRFQNVTETSLRAAADLVEFGAPPAAVSEQVFDNRTFAATRILGAALTSLSRSADGRIVWAHITQADFMAAGATDEDTEGIVNYVRGVRGAYVGILFREMPGNRIRVSIRGRDVINVAEIAKLFGGGGHTMAAGFGLNLPLAEAEQIVLEAVIAALPGE